MKSIVVAALAFLFIGQSFFPKGFAMSEISKVYKLIEHYQEHLSETNPDISFAEFLWMHYNPASDHNDAIHGHDRLPKISFGSGFIALCAPIIRNLITSLTEVTDLRTLQTSEYKNGYYYLFFVDVLNPPQ